jgi:predicted dehydrogenase
LRGLRPRRVGKAAADLGFWSRGTPAFISGAKAGLARLRARLEEQRAAGGPAAGESGMEPVRWGVLGLGMIGLERTMPAMAHAPHARLTAIASRDPAKSARVAASYPGVSAHPSYEALLADAAVEAVYLPLPNHLHVEWSARAMQAGKHVLCEKPLSLSAGDIRGLCAVRDETGRHIEEAFVFRNHPQWEAIAERIGSGSLGPVRAAQATIAKQFFDPKDIRNDPALGGGALYDLGSYVISSFNMIFGRPPRRVVAAIERDPAFKIDRLTSALLDYGDAHASFTAASQAGTDGWGTHQHLSILARDGWMRADFPFAQARPTECRLFVGDDKSVGNLATEIITFPAVNQYALQVERFSRKLRGAGVAAWPIEDALWTAETIEALFTSARENAWRPVGHAP